MVRHLLLFFAVALSVQLLIVTSSGAPVKAPTSPVKSPVAGNKPTKKPSRAPTKKPSKAPTKKPFKVPTKQPFKAPTKKPSKAPTKKPVVSVPTISPSVRASLIKTQIQNIVGAQKLANTTTPHYRALQWILNADRMKLGPNAKNLVQRYIAVLFYYSTTKSGPWPSCNPPVNGQSESCSWAQLISVLPSEYDYIPAIRWLSGRHECQWAGIVCDSYSNVTRSLELYGQNISSTLPAELIHFPYLDKIVFDWNHFHGTLPPEWGLLRITSSIEIQNNELEGTVPDSWWNIKTLQRLNIGQNLLSGSISSSVGGLKYIIGLFTTDNMFTGSLPSQLGLLNL